MRQALFFRESGVHADSCPFPPLFPFVLIDLWYHVGVFPLCWGIHHLQLRNQSRRTMHPSGYMKGARESLCLCLTSWLSLLRDVKPSLFTSHGLRTLTVYNLNATRLFWRFWKYDYNLILTLKFLSFPLGRLNVPLIFGSYWAINNKYSTLTLLALGCFIGIASPLAGVRL